MLENSSVQTAMMVISKRFARPYSDHFFSDKEDLKVMKVDLATLRSTVVAQSGNDTAS